MNKMSFSSNRSAKISKPPMLWLGHLIGAKPEPWRTFEIPGVILNAYQIHSLGIKKAEHLISNHLGSQVPTMIDSGGYNFLKNPEKAIEIEELAEIYRNSKAEIVVSLDIPPYPKLSDYEKRKRWDRTRKNAYQLAKAMDNQKVMPVVHGYSKKSLRYHSKQIRDLIDDSGMIGLGGIVPLLKVKRNLTLELIHFLKTEYPDRFLHVFGVGSVSTMMLLAALGVDSMDTIGWRIKAAYGAIQLVGQSDRFVSPKIGGPKTRKGLSKGDTQLLKECECPVCKGQTLRTRKSRLDNGKSSTFSNRATHNCWTFTKEIERTQKALNEGTLFDILEDRMSEGYWRSSYEHVKRLVEKAA